MKSPRRLSSHALTLVLLATLTQTAVAQGGAWSDEFDRPGLLGRVFAVSEFGGEIVAGGLSVQADGQVFGNVARFDGQHWQSLGAGIHGDIVEDFAIYHGELVAAGGFTLAGGASMKSIARWDGSQWRPLGGGLGKSWGFEGGVAALAVYQDELYAAGLFDRADNVVVANVARWDGTQWHSVGTGFNGVVYSLKVGGDGKLYAGGAFGTAGGTSATNIAAWDGTSWSAVGPGIGVAFNSPVRALEWHDSKLWAGGYFDIPGGALHEKLASWNGSTWQGEGSFPDSSIGVQIDTLQSFGPDLYVAGNIVSVNGMGVDRIARRTGSQWSSIGGVRGFPNENVVLALAVHAGELVVGGNFTHVGTSFAPGAPIVTNSIAGFDGTSWKQISKGLGFNGSVSGGMLWNGGVVAVGSFDEAGRSKVPSLAFYDGNDWSPLGQFNNAVYDTIVFQNELVVTGPFSNVDGQPFVGVAAFNGTAWHGFGAGFNGSYGGQALAVYQNQLYAGGIGGVKRWNGATWEVFAPQVLSSVDDMHVHNNVLYMGGYSFGSGGHIASWDGSTQQSVGGGMNGAVRTLTSFAGDLVVGGSFTQAGGVAANRLARWNGSTWSAFAGITGQEVSTLAVFGGELYATGNPLLFGSTTSYIARWSGTQWVALAGGIDGSASVMIADEGSGRLYVGGSFTKAGGKPSWNFARFEIPSVSAPSFCLGDGTATACPCGNVGSAGNGCANSAFAAGARLVSSGNASASNSDTLVLTAMSVPGPGLFIQGDGQQGGGMGLAFGDGLLCMGGTLTRLGIVFPTASSASYPGGLTPNPIHVAGGTTAGDVRHYQCWYRDAATFCSAFTFNLTQGLTVTWGQ